MVVKHCEKEIEMWILMRSIRSSSPDDFRYNKRIDGQIRLQEKRSLYGELELKNGLFQESPAKACQEIEN